MSKRTLGILMWVPGLQWLFLRWLRHPETTVEEAWRIVDWHAVYAGVTFGAVPWVVAYLVCGRA